MSRVSSNVPAYVDILLKGRYVIETTKAGVAREGEPNESVWVIPRIVEGPPDPTTGEDVEGLTLDIQSVNTRPDDSEVPDFVTEPGSNWDGPESWKRMLRYKFSRFQRAHGVDANFDTDDLVGKRYGVTLDIKGKNENKSTYVKYWDKPVE